MARETPEGDELQPLLARLPPGRHGLPRDFVTANHRDRLMAACVQEVDGQGYTEMTVADIIKTAAVSRRTFYEFFDSKEACFLAAYDVIISHITQVVVEAYGSEERWPEQVCAGLRAFLRLLAEDARLAKFCMVEPIAAGPPLADHHRDSVQRFSALLDTGREWEGALDPPSLTADAVIAGAASLIIQRISEGEAEQLERLLPDILASVLAPYLGPTEAERIARE
jgi:AcrR family transcriptional regulator